MLPLSVIGVAVALSPAPDFLVDQWTIADGLPLNHLTDLAFTADGLLWISSFDGVMTFDGVTFREAPGEVMAALGTSRVPELVVHPDGAIWLQGEARSTVRYDGRSVRTLERYGAFGRHTLGIIPNTDGTWLITDDGLFSLSDRAEPFHPEDISGLVVGTARLPDGRRAVGLTERILLSGPGGTLQELPLPEAISPPLVTLQQLQDGGLWILGDQGVTAGIWKDGQWRLTAGSQDDPPACVIPRWLHAIPCAPQGGEGSGWRVSREAVYFDGERILTMPAPGAKAILDRDGSLWICTQGAGLLRVRPRQLQVTRSGLADERVDMVMLDESDRLWLRSPSEGCQVITAPDGVAGLEQARLRRPAVIVSDVMMPGMDGLTMARQLRSDPALAHIPIVLVSAKTRSEDRVAGLAVAEVCLNKPFHVPELRAHVHRLLGAAPRLSPGMPRTRRRWRRLIASSWSDWSRRCSPG
jgi:CheY-like chemotaxis protein